MKEDTTPKIILKDSEEKRELIPQQPKTMLEFAEALFKSGMFPQAKSPYGVLAIIEYGRELGIPPVVALQNMAELKGRICISAQLLLALALQKGVSYRILESTDKVCKIEFRRGDRVYISTFTFEEAQRIGLTTKDSWKNYPSDMLFARCVSRGIKRIAPDVGLGITTFEEMEGVQIEEVDEKLTEEQNLETYDVQEESVKETQQEQKDEIKEDKYEKLLKAIDKLEIPRIDVTEFLGVTITELPQTHLAKFIKLLEKVKKKELTWEEIKEKALAPFVDMTLGEIELIYRV